MINQHESTYYDSYVDMVKRTHRRIGSAFPVSMVYQTHIPTYPSGHWLFGFASKNLHPIYDLKADEWKKFGIKTRYYNTELHKGCFALPNYVLDVLEDCD
ncbi:spermidine synthase [Ruminococcus sp. CAG:57]|nr:spermidine synthase [Ruminococcus sp. CAG:57]